MKHDVGDALYDSSSSVSSDSGAGSHSSSRLSSHDFLSSIAAGTTNNTTPPNNLVSLDGLHSGVPTRTTPTLTPTTLRSIEQTFLELTSESGSHSREAGFVPPLVEPSQPTPAQTHNTAGHHNSNNNHHHNNNNNNNNSSHNLTNTNNSSSNSETGSNNSNSNSNTNICQGINNGVNGNSNNSNGDNNQQQQQEEQLAGLGIGLGLGLGLGHGIGGIGQPQQQQQQTRRNMGGRRPNRTIGMSPEEEERRQVRRERNKMAAARCRKRRMDHTNALMEETDGLEQKKQSLQDEIQQLQQAKDELEFILEAHRAVCRLRASSPQDIKPVIKTNDIQQQQQQQQQHHHQQQQQQQQHHVENEFAEPLLKRASIASGKPNRPNSLAVGFDNNNRPNSLAIFTEPKERPDTLQFKTVETPAFMKTVQEVAGIPITTPSSGIPFNFESLMEGGTGLTPVSTPLIPSCSSQQRNNLSAVDLSSPDANPPKLVSL